MLVPQQKILTDIDSGTWEHPADKAALTALKQIPGFDEIIKVVFGLTTEKSIKLLHLSSSIRTSENQFPLLHQQIRKIASIFDWDYIPEVYVTRSPFFNAGVYGVKEPFIVINSQLVNSLGSNELMCVLAHEMGHLISGHSLYKTLLWLVLNISFTALPVSDLLMLPVIAALKEWDRKSELSADRAGLLAVQDENPSYSVLMRMAGGDKPSELNMNDFFIQADEYENSKEILDSIHKVLNTVWASHPFPVIRLTELRNWIAAGSYSKIINGDYLRRGRRGSTVAEDMKESFKYYKKETEKEADPVYRVIRNLGEGAAKIGDDVTKVFRDFFKG
ncbi:MAG: M48 family metallopeptidase [Spirochaetales bacterium]|nr:M48 family metallopeptidase [Spirochaetales bacterium]